MSADPQGQSPSVARSFSGSELDGLRELARNLPDGWCVTSEPPYGQLVMTPARGYHFSCRVLVFSSSGREGPARTHAAARR